MWQREAVQNDKQLNTLSIWQGISSGLLAKRGGRVAHVGQDRRVHTPEKSLQVQVSTVH